MDGKRNDVLQHGESAREVHAGPVAGIVVAGWCAKRDNFNGKKYGQVMSEQQAIGFYLGCALAVLSVLIAIAWHHFESRNEK